MQATKGGSTEANITPLSKNGGKEINEEVNRKTLKATLKGKKRNKKS